MVGQASCLSFIQQSPPFTKGGNVQASSPSEAGIPASAETTVKGAASSAPYSHVDGLDIRRSSQNR